MTKLASQSPFRRHRRLLTLSTAIGGLIAAPAAGQSLPGPSDVVSTTVSTPGLAPVVSVTRGGDRLDVLLNAKNTIIDWNGFNIPESKRADFRSNSLLRLQKIAVLNRDVSGKTSKLLGNLTSSDNVAVWVINPNGILIGSKARISTGSLVLSTLGVANGDFLDGNNANYNLSDSLQPTSAGGASAITVANGARITVSGGNRGLVMVSPKIDADGAFSSDDQDVAFVTAADVDLAYGDDDSPLSVTINRGTAVAGTSQFIRGSVAGRDALFALASRSTITDALLRVDADVTTAAPGVRGIVLSAGKPAVAVAGVTVAGTDSETSGVVGLTVNGDLKAAGSTRNGANGGNVLAAASGASSFSGALTSTRDIQIAIGGAASLTGAFAASRDILLSGGGATLVTGAVTAGRDYGVSGTAVTLGSASGKAVAQKANGTIDIAAVESVTGRSGLTLQSNADGSSGREALTLSLSTPAQSGANTIAFAPGSNLLGGTASRQSAVRIRSATALSSLSLGNVTALDLQGAIGSADFTNSVQSLGAVTTGDVSVTGDLALSGSALTAGKLTSGNGAIALTSTLGDLQSGDLKAHDAITLTSAGLLKTSRIDSGESFTANAVGAATIGGDLIAGDDLLLRAGSIQFGGARASSGGTIDLTASVDGITSGANFRLSSSSSNRNDFVRLQAAGAAGIDLTRTSTITGGTNQALRVAIHNSGAGAPLVLGDVTARALIGLPTFDADPNMAPAMAQPITTDGSLTFGKLNLIDSFAALSTGGDLTVGSIAVSGQGQGISLAAPAGKLSVQSTVSADGDVLLQGGTALTLDLVESRHGTASVTSGGALDLRALSGETAAIANGTSVKIGTVKGGVVSLTTSAGDLTLGQVSGKDIALSATGGGLSVANGITSTTGVTGTATGDLNVAGLVDAKGGPVSLTATGGDVALLGGVSSAGEYTASGQSVTLGGQHKADGAISITSTAGSISGRPGSSILGDADGVGADAIALSSTGGAILLGGTNIRSGGQALAAVTVTAGDGGIALGNVTAGSLTLAGATLPPVSITTGDLTLAQGFEATAQNGVTTGTIKVGDGGVGIDGGSGLVKVGTIDATGAVALTGGSVNFGRITGGATSLLAATGSVSGGDVDATGAFSASAQAGTIDLGTVKTTGAGSDVTLSSLGTLSANAITAGGGATLTTTGAGADIRLNDRLTAVDAVTVTSARDIQARSLASTKGTLTVRAPNGRLLGVDANGIDLAAGAGKLLTVEVGDSVTLNEITGGPVSITAAAITVGQISADQNAVSLAASNGDLRVNGPVVAGDVNFTATGYTDVKSVSASGFLTLNGDESLRFDDISGTTITATSDGAITGRSATAAGALTLTGGSLSLDAARATSGLALTATAGDAVLGSLSAGGDIAVVAANRARIGGDVGAGGAYTVTGADVVLGAQTATQRAGGAIAITATSGDIQSAGDLTLTNDLANASAPILLDAAGAIRLGGSRIETAALGLHAGDGQTVTLGVIDAGLIGGLDGATVGGSFVHSGSVTTGEINTRDISVALSSGDLTTGAVLASGSVNLSTAAGSVTTGAINAATVDLSGATTVSVGPIDASGVVTATGGSIIANSIRGSAIDLRTAGRLSGTGTNGTALTATGGAIVAKTGEATLDAVSATGDVDLSSTAGITARSIGGAAVTLSATDALSAELVVASGLVTAGGGSIAVDAISGGAIALQTAGTLSGNGTATAMLTATDGGVTARSGEATLGAVSATGAVDLSSTAGITARSVKGAAVQLAAVNSVSVDSIDASSAVAVRGGGILANLIRGGSIDVTTDGDLQGLGGGRTTLAATVGDVTVAAGLTRLASVSAAGGVAIDATAIDATGAITAARQVMLTADNSLATADVTAGGDAALTAGGALTAGSLVAGGGLAVAGNGVAVSVARAGGALMLTSGGDIDLGRGEATGAATIDAMGLATLGALSAGSTLTVRAADAEITGIQRAATVTFQNNAPSTGALRIGDGTANDGFRLSNAEIALVQSDVLRLDQGSGAVEIGTLTFGLESGREAVDVLTTGAVTIDGVVSGGGLGRNVRIGGGDTDGAATDIRVHSTPTAGGRLLLGDANLELRGARIAVGLDQGFLDALTPGEAGRAQAQAFIGDGNSALYNAGLGGAVYAPGATTTVSAHNLTLKFTDFALFQNTGVPGRFSGVVLGGTPAMPVLPALTIRSNGVPGQSSFALFGTINGIGDASAALLGTSVIDIDSALLSTSRINGCLAGSGAGCLTTIVIQPTLQIFSWDSEDVFGVAQDVSIPFSPTIGGNNEELLTGLPALSPEGGSLPAPVPATEPVSDTGQNL